MSYDLIIIGSGPGGYVAAIRAGQVGLKTALIEEAAIGGMCLNWGCIPTKALLESAKRLEAVRQASTFGVDGVDVEKLSFNWQQAGKRSEHIVRRLTKGVEYLLKKNGVEIVKGRAVINSGKSVSVENRLLETRSIIIATGSVPAKLDYPVPADIVVEIKDLLRLEQLPRQLVVVGSGPHAVELAQFFDLAGREVKLLVPGEVMAPQLDPYLSDYLKKSFKKVKIDVLTLERIKGYEEGEIIINASDRRAVLPESKIELSLDNGFIQVDGFLKTSLDGIYAVGDVNGRSIFAHAASAQGLHAVNVINGLNREMDFGKFPINIYTYPEIAQLGLGEPALKEKGIDYKVSEFPLSANGKALTEGHTEGFIRLLSDKKYGEVLGVQIVADHATDMIAEAAAVMQLEGTIFDVAATIHAHPTVSEIFMEAGFAAFDQPIHK
jgi:dihydrolipoamide dehydrogenase